MICYLKMKFFSKFQFDDKVYLFLNGKRQKNEKNKKKLDASDTDDVMVFWANVIYTPITTIII